MVIKPYSFIEQPSQFQPTCSHLASVSAQAGDGSTQIGQGGGLPRLECVCSARMGKRVARVEGWVQAGPLSLGGEGERASGPVDTARQNKGALQGGVAGGGEDPASSMAEAPFYPCMLLAGAGKL